MDMDRNKDQAIEIYVRMISAKQALVDAQRIALDAAPPAYLPDIIEALGCVDRLMLECASGNLTLGLVMPVVNRVVMDYASREGNKPGDN